MRSGDIQNIAESLLKGHDTTNDGFLRCENGEIECFIELLGVMLPTKDDLYASREKWQVRLRRAGATERL